jgi:hypothetical protein
MAGRAIKALTAAVVALLLCGAASAQDPPQPYKPRNGMVGKDVPWVPTQPAMIATMLQLARVTPSDFVMDLGSGDGRNIIAAARLGASGLGVEFNRDLVVLSRQLAAQAGVSDKARFVEGDMYQADISRATVLALFLLPMNMRQLAPRFVNLAPGTRIVSNTFGIAGWEPDARARLDGVDCGDFCEALLWIVPAKVQGTWEWPGGALVLQQSYQVISGTIRRGDANAPLAQAKLRGEEISFTAGGLAYTGRVKGNVIEGTATSPIGTTVWRATRR